LPKGTGLDTTTYISLENVSDEIIYYHLAEHLSDYFDMVNP
jgi:hypothetical protein